MTRPYRKVTPLERADREAADWSDPWPMCKVLAARYNRDPRTVLQWAQNRGLVPRGGPRRLPTDAELETIREAARAGKGWLKTAESIGLHPSQALHFFEAALRPLLVAGLVALLLGCATQPVDAPAPSATWAPLACDVPEVIVWETGGVRTTERRVLALIDAPPEDVIVRVLRPERDPCASLEPGTCTVVYDTSLSPEGRWHYYAPGSAVVTGLEDGTARVLCSVTVASSGRGEYVETFARGGEYLVR